MGVEKMIKEIIVVEGRDDISAVKKAVDAEIIATSGYHISRATIERIKKASETRGIIIFTDPDRAGDMIRKRLSDMFKESKHAFLPLEQATKEGDIGIENASPEDIIAALTKARAETTENREEFSKEDLNHYGLIGRFDSSKKREALGKFLGVGYANGKQFLKRINNYGVTREEFVKGVERLSDER
jgi:ribonuclease M5